MMPNGPVGASPTPPHPHQVPMNRMHPNNQSSQGMNFASGFLTIVDSKQFRIFGGGNSKITLSTASDFIVFPSFHAVVNKNNM